MRAKAAARLKRSAPILALILSLGVGGCESVDSALFGGSDENAPADTTTSAPGTLPSSDTSAPPPSPAAEPAPVTSSGGPGTPPPSYSSSSSYGGPGTLPPSAAPAASGPGYGGTGTMGRITPIAIEPGSDTGTAVSKTIQGLRAQVQTLEEHIASSAQQLADLRASGASETTAYHTAKAQITTRLQIGTTRGNPELVSEWNTAQAALDQLSGNINGLNALGNNIANDSSAAHYALDTINATFDVSGAVDEDHRQLSVLEDETNQTVVLIDRLLREASQDIQRQTAYVANERANLTTLSGAIKEGELYGADVGSAPLLAPSTAYGPRGSYSGPALVTIRFDRYNVDYRQSLYTALTEALQARPGASFQIVGVSPSRGSAAAVQLSQTDAKRHAREVLHAMTNMGVPATRLAVSSSTDPGLGAPEVRVFVR
ncbi:MAG TPA: hypothetical protein VGG10_00960 [Rhizomicrobium sp.]|jgi:hypothetical protein